VALVAIPLLCLHFAFTVGLAFALSALTTVYRDVATSPRSPCCSLLGEPILYTADMAPHGLQVFFR